MQSISVQYRKVAVVVFIRVIFIYQTGLKFLHLQSEQVKQHSLWSWKKYLTYLYSLYISHAQGYYEMSLSCVGLVTFICLLCQIEILFYKHLYRYLMLMNIWQWLICFQSCLRLLLCFHLKHSFAVIWFQLWKVIFFSFVFFSFRIFTVFLATWREQGHHN